MTASTSETFEPEICSFTLGRAEEEVRPCRIGADVWSIYALHQPPVGGKLANRCVLYRVENASGGKPYLVVVNGITPDLERDEPFGAIRRLADELGAEVRHIFNPGPEHHVSLMHYARAFPDAQVYVAAGRIERENPELCRLGNVRTMHPGDNVPELAAGGFHVHVWDGLMEGKVPNVIQSRFRAKRGTAEPTLFFHEPSRTLMNGGHGWLYWGEGSFFPWLARKMFKMKQGEVVWSPVHYYVFDEGRCAASAARVLDWDFDRLLDLHTPMNDHMESGAYAAVEKLCRPIVEGRWQDVPLKHQPLQIPEGKVTGGDWKSY